MVINKNQQKSSIFYNFCKHFGIQGILKSSLFKEAMTHSSISKKKNYERMEFLGDTILNFCISRMLFEEKKNIKEGELSKKKSFLCSRRVCLLVAKNIGLQEQILASKKQKINIDFILADVVESLLCLIFYEFGIEKVYEIVVSLFSIYMNSDQSIDPKMCLQEITQKRYKQLPVYCLISKEGLEHRPIFKVSASCGNFYTEGIGENKKEAEKHAAEKMISLLNDEN